MSERQEMVDDIIAEKRRRADEIERDCAEKMKRGEMVSDCYARELVADIRREADRLEAAYKREIDALKQRLAELNAEVAAKDEVIKRLNDAVAEEQTRKMATTEKSSAVGDAAKLREAVIKTQSVIAKCMDILNKIPECGYNVLIDDVADELCDLREKHIKAALSARPRNCDLPEVAKGQPKLTEQAWRVFRRSHKDSYLDAYGLLRCIGWILDPATEKEGGDK